MLVGVGGDVGGGGGGGDGGGDDGGEHPCLVHHLHGSASKVSP